MREGLSRRQRELSPKYFYDERGSELFEEITRLPEYYLTRAERAILEARARADRRVAPARERWSSWAPAARRRRASCSTRCAMPGASRTYVPVDVSEEFLDETARALEREYPALGVAPVVADIARLARLAGALPRPVLFAFLGSTIGNFDAPRARVAAAPRSRGDAPVRSAAPRDRSAQGRVASSKPHITIRAASPRRSIGTCCAW